MKVNIHFETKDMEGHTEKSSVMAVLERRKNDYRLVYVEDLSGEGNMTKSTLTISEDSLRILRDGEIVTDFAYGNALIHNTVYKSQYGTMPLTITTSRYDYELVKDTGDEILINAAIEYSMAFAGQEPMDMEIRLQIC